MREHEVPTHVQAEDRVLLWFTFPQIVALTAVCALSYGVYRYAPVGPSEVRMALAVLLGLMGLAAVVGQIGGRRLPLVVADLLKYRLGARRYVGPPSQLVRSEPLAPVQPVRSGPGPLRLMARRAGETLRNLRRRRNGRERQGGRMPFDPHRWFRKRRGRREQENGTHQRAQGRDQGREGEAPEVLARLPGRGGRGGLRRRPCPWPSPRWPWPTATRTTRAGAPTRSSSGPRSRSKGGGSSSRS